jgi:ABC-type multidrug transport system fused ATPase/permease subunit
MQAIINAAVDKVPLEEFLKVVSISFIYLGFVAIFFPLNYIGSSLYINRCIYEFRNSYYSNLINSKYADISSEDSGKYISALTNDANIISDQYFNNWIYLPENIINIIGSFVAVMYINWIIGLIMLGMTVFVGIIPGLFIKQIEKANLERSNSLANYTGKLKENLLGSGIIKSYNAEKKFSDETKLTNRKLLKWSNRHSVVNHTTGISAMIISTAITLTMVAISGYLAIQGKIDFGAIVAIITLSEKFYGPIQQLAGRLFTIVSVRKINNKLLKVIDRNIDNQGKDNTEFKKNISLNGVSFRYKANDRLILDNVTIEFEKNKKYMILGKSGSGKTTILKLISKIYDKYEGSITIDNEDYKNLSDACINKRVALAQQNCYLFNKSLQDNIDIFGNKNIKKLMTTLAEVKLQNFIDKLPLGIDTVIDEEVNQVSGGEKLRINLARALYRDSDVLLLDEITSAIDRATSDEIERMILAIKDKTLINVCHKFNDDFLWMYDKIFIIEEGRIVLEGSYSDIYKNPKLLEYKSSNKEDN